MSISKVSAFLATVLLVVSLSAQNSDDSKYTDQYNKLYKAYVKEPYDVSNLLAMAMFYSDTANPMQDYPMAMKFASQAESLYVAIIEDNDRYREAKRLIKKNITVPVVQQTKRHVVLEARRHLVKEEFITEEQLDKYNEAFKNDSYTLQLVESRRIQTKYRLAQETNTLAAYRSFISSYGSTQEGEEAASNMGMLASSIVSNAKTESEVDRLLDGYLDMDPVRDAAFRKKSAIAYANLQNNPSPKAYQDYLKKYPGSDGYSTVLARMDEQLNQEFHHLHSARQYADFAINYPDNPLADEAMSRLKSLITDQRDMEALHIYLAEFPLDVSYNDIYLKVFNWHTEEGNLAPVELFAQRFPDFPYTMAVQDAMKAARKLDSIDIPRSFSEKDFSAWASKIYHLTGKKESFVALQRTISNFISAKQWKKALERLDFFSLSFEDNCVDEVAELRSIIENATDSRLALSAVVRPAYDFMHPVMHPDGKKLFFNRDIDGQSHIQVAVPTPGKKGTVWKGTGDIVFSNFVNSDITIYSLFDNGNKMLLGNNGDIMIAELTDSDGTWTVIETLPPPVNDPEAYDFDACMLPDGSGILFSSDRPDGHNLQPSFSYFHGDYAVASDIYFAPYIDGKWGKPVNLGININSPYKECSPVISDDLKTLYFVTDARGLGFGDIYYATRDNIDDWSSWSKAVNYGKEVNTNADEKSISISSATNSLIICSNTGSASNTVHYGCYSAPLFHTINADFTRVQISADNVGFTAEIVELDSRKSIGRPISVNQNSSWNGLLHTNQQYIIYAHQQGLYIPALIFSPSQNPNPAPQILSAATLLDMADQDKPLILNGILFVDNSASLEPCSAKEIDHLADFLMRNPNVGAEIACHVGADRILRSDNNESLDATSFKLSHDRADRVKQELVNRGIHPDRIATSPFGNSQTKAGLATECLTLTLHRLE